MNRIYALIAAATLAGILTVWLLRDRAPSDPPPATAAAPASLPEPATPPPPARPERAPEGGESKGGTPPPPTPGATTTAGISSTPVAPGPTPPPLTASAPAAPPASPYPDGLSAAEERALRIRHLLELRELVATTDARLASGDPDPKLAAFRDEEAARLADLETWAAAHGVTAAELDRATERLADLRAAAVVDPPRPR